MLDTDFMTLTSSKLRAARGLLGWSQSRLGNAADVGVSTIANYEAGRRTLHPRTEKALVEVLEAEGVEFTERGVQLREGGR